MKFSEILSELRFKGSACTNDCSGHQAGYNWSKRNPDRDCASRSPSFTKGCNIAKKEKDKPQQESEFAGSYPTGPKGQAKGKAKMPKAKKGRKRHPLQGKFVGGS